MDKVLVIDNDSAVQKILRRTLVSPDSKWPSLPTVTLLFRFSMPRCRAS